MSQVARLIASATIAVFVTVAAMLFATEPTSAKFQDQRIAVCTELQSSLSPQHWMNQQLSGGKTQFVQAGNRICAW